jgi:hypothetical protein
MKQTKYSAATTGLLSLLLATLLFAAPAHAVNYDVEIIIFEHVRNSGVGRSNTMLLPVINGAQRIPQQAETNAPIQPLPQLRLQAEAEKINQSENHRLLYHGGWRQTDYNQESAPYMRIALGQQVPMFVERGDPDSVYLRGFSTPPANNSGRYSQVTSATVYGGVKVWVGRFLHFETLLSYTPPGSSQSYAMESDRRMRSRQIHYIDNPRMGIITKIFPVDETAPN